MSMGRGSHIRDIGERVQGQLIQKLGMLDVLQVVFPDSTVGMPVLKQDMRPVGCIGILEEQEGLPTDRPASGNAWALGSVELDCSLEISEAGALLESLPPPRPIVGFVSALVVSCYCRRRQTYLESSSVLIAMTILSQGCKRGYVDMRVFVFAHTRV